MRRLRTAPHKAAVLLLLVLAVGTGCSSADGVIGDGGNDDGGDAAKTPAAIFDAQSELYGALFENPPNFDTAVEYMSSACREQSSDAQEVLSVVIAEVELAESGDISEESVLEVFSEIAYTIDGDVADGDDGSQWLYEEGGWKSADC